MTARCRLLCPAHNTRQLWGEDVFQFKRIVAAALACIVASAPILAQDSLDDRGAFVRILSDSINALEGFVFKTVTIGGLEVEWIVAFLALPMIVLTLYFGFVNLTSFKRAWRIIKGDYHDPKADGEVTQFQALSTALSGTVGLGNIAGVAVAISTGGPGATFWMILIGFCAMSLKFAECTLGVKYRVVREDGTVAGGPMYYLERGLKSRGEGWAKVGKILAWSYAIIAVPTLLQVAQVNQSYEAISIATGYNSQLAQWGFGFFIAGMTAIVIIGGIKSIAQVTSRLVPAMAGIYILTAVVILAANAQLILPAFEVIFSKAMSLEAGLGGLVGTIIIAMQRAVYSTEAGLGSATMAHAAAKTNEPVSEGMVALMEPFIDTVIVSTMTALVIVIATINLGGDFAQEDAVRTALLQGVQLADGAGTNTTGITLTSQAFANAVSWFPWVLAFAAFLFAFSTIISWGYYSGKVWEFVFGGSNRSMMTFKIVFCVALIPGALLTAGEVYSLMDSMFFLMAVPNVIGIYLLAPELKRDLKSYLSRLRTGEIKANN
ncbi:MAG: alanine:cation symporter family protein [Alphaproteobacteria bacterium]|nr:alanine:cation symporter family protein [Alphaproteobacteria bacterium]